MIEAPISRPQFQAIIRDNRAASALVITNISREDLTALQKSLEKQIRKNKNSVIVIFPAGSLAE